MDKKKIGLIALVALIMISCTSAPELKREQDFNFDWKFALDIEGDASVPNFDDSNWKDVRLPHDWSVAFEFDSVQGEGCTAYLLGGVGWYRKTFTTHVDKTQKVFINFDGIYNHSEVWINGVKLGYRPYGYVPMVYDLTPHLSPKGKDNEIVVKVDHSRYADSRWYTGSGIYRNVKLITTSNLYIPEWGTFITTPSVEKEKALVNIQTTISNETGATQTCDIVTKIVDAKGKKVAEIKTSAVAMNGGTKELKQQLGVKNPNLWSLDEPHLYNAHTSIVCDGKVLDTYITTFGIRTLKWDKETGFYLNGENMKIKGVCLHHDGGLVGAAVPKEVWKRRLQILKDGGTNAVRISHNPASTEFLELCDELGILVQDEFFDEWDYPKDKRLNMKDQHDDYITRGSADYFQEWAERDLKDVMLAHRNHPSIFQWSIGNEIEWTYPRNRKATGFFDNMNWDGNYFWSPSPYTPEQIKAEYNSQPALKYTIEETAHKLANWTRELDTSRPVIANCILPSASFETGYADALDIVGFSYRRVMYDYAKENYPDKIVMGTENLAQWHEWKAIEERPFISGTFLWTGIDYMGERNNQWPTKTLASGLLDQAGFKKPSYHMYKTLWTDEPHIYVCSQTADKSQYKVAENGKIVEKKPGAWEQALWIWYDVNEHWNYKAGEKVIVEVISNCEEVELFQNNKSLGTKRLADFPDRIYKWAVDYTKGTITAKDKNGKIEASVVTASEPVGIKLNLDNQELAANGYDLAHLVAQLVDANGNPVKTENRELQFSISQNLQLLGVDNGSPSNVQAFQQNKIITAKGRALGIVQAKLVAGTAKITVSAKDLEPATISLKIK